MSNGNKQQYGRIALGVCLAACLVGLVHADIIFFRPGVTLPVLPEGMEVLTYKQSPTKTLKAVRGRIMEVDSKDFSLFRFQPAKIVTEGKRSKVVWATKAGKPDYITVSLTDTDSIWHEIDGMQDLRWIFSNRDDLLRKMGISKVYFGYEPFHSYFLAAGKVKPLSPKLKPIPANLMDNLQEGWLVNVLKNGPRGASQRDKEMGDMFRAMAAGKKPMRHPGFIPSLQETDVQIMVHGLLSAAIRDKAYAGIYYKTPANRKPTFYLVSRQTVQVLADLVKETNTIVREVGYGARAAVILRLENATLGRLTGDERVKSPATSKNTAAALTLQMRRLEREATYKQTSGDFAGSNIAIDKAMAIGAEKLKAEPGHAPTLKALERLKKLKMEIATSKPVPQSGPKPAMIESYFPVDPSESAILAMEIISRSDSWQVPYIDSDRNNPGNRQGGERLVSALMKLANKDSAGIKARARDVARIQFVDVKGYGKITALDEAIVSTLEHLFAGEKGNVFQSKVAHFMVGSLDESTLAFSVMLNAGFADADTMNEVINNLFAIGTSHNEVEKDRPEELRIARKALRNKISHNAIVSLMRLASLADSDTPANVIIGNLVAKRAAELMGHLAQGFGTSSDQRFFDSIRAMRRKSNPTLKEYAVIFSDALKEQVNIRIRTDKSDDDWKKVLRRLLNEYLHD